MQELLKRVLKRLLPSKNLERKILKIKLLVFKKLKKVLPSDVEVLLCGSVAKGTYLKNNVDIDVFLLFGPNYPVAKIKKLGIFYAKKAFKGFKTEVRYAQHPYLKVFIKQLKIDIVPSSKIENLQKIKTAVDRSQLHTLFINSNLKEEQRNDVRLLKKFLDVLGVYGASLRVEGFSGYLCELLILHYGSFIRLLQAVAYEWKKETIIDIKGFYKKEEALKKFFPATFIVVDPTDKNRNVAAVVSRTSFSRFILAARKFLSKPQQKFFFSKPISISLKSLKKKIIQRGSNCLVLTFLNPGLVEDILWPQLKKTATQLLSALEGEGFRTLGHYFYADEKTCFILLELIDSNLPNIKHLVGPEIFDQDNINSFVLKHKNALNIHLEHYNIVAIEKRKITNAVALLKEKLKNPTKLGIPKGLQKEIKNCKIYNAIDLLDNKAFFNIAVDYFLRKIY
ncbi:MAG: CCA tRNA nucleotidyltransferase [Candidatus Anstonellaceae archaeon]